LDLRFDVNISLLFTELPFLERPAAAAGHGFDVIESWWPFTAAVPASNEVDSMVRAIEDAGVRLHALNFYSGDMPAGERGLVSVPSRSAEFRDSVAALVDIARLTGCRLFNALYGVRQPGVDAASQDELAIENLAFAAQAVAALGGTVLLEPLARHENGSYPLTSPSEVCSVIDRVMAETGNSNIGLLADFYHLTRNGHAWRDVIDGYVHRFGHVQIADAPGRHQPGTGDIDFPALFGTLSAAGYGGHVGIEYRPEGPTEESFSWLPAAERSTERRP
jgi:hydroxypyruvate isomerase